MQSHQEFSMPPRAAVNVWPDFGRMIGVGRGAAYGLVNSGRVRVVRVGSRILVPVTAIQEFLDTESPEARTPS